MTQKKTQPISMRGKAVFLDRDGVINPLIFFKDAGVIDSPFCVRQFKLLPKVEKAVKLLSSLGYKIFIVSNQPGIAKNKYDLSELDKINAKMIKSLRTGGATLDGVYYCLHHPEALNKKYRKK